MNKMTQWRLVRASLSHPRIRDGVFSLITLLVGGGALLGADHGMPVWLQIPIYLWLVTVGLPTTLTVLLLAAFWGRWVPFHGFGWFCGLAIVLSPIMQSWAIQHVFKRIRRPQGAAASIAHGNQSAISQPVPTGKSL